MSYFKKFTDFCAGAAAFVAGLFLLQKYMAFKPLDLESYIARIASNAAEIEELSKTITEPPSKLKQFFTPLMTNEFDYRFFLILFFVIAFAVLVGLIFKKFPQVCFVFSVFPAITVAYMLEAGILYEHEGVLLALTAIPLVGNLVECIMRDKDDGGHRLSIIAKATSLLPAALCLVLVKFCKELPLDFVDEKLPIYGDIALNMSPENIEILSKLGWIYLGIFLITLILYNVYFIDVILSAVPLVYLIYLLYGKFLTVLPATLTTLAAICFATHLALCVFENNLSKKEQLAAKEQEKPPVEASTPEEEEQPQQN